MTSKLAHCRTNDVKCSVYYAIIILPKSLRTSRRYCLLQSLLAVFCDSTLACFWPLSGGLLFSGFSAGGGLMSVDLCNLPRSRGSVFKALATVDQSWRRLKTLQMHISSQRWLLRVFSTCKQSSQWLYSRSHRSRIRILWILKKFKIHEFYWILKYPLNFILIFSSLILTEQIQVQFFTELQSQKHSIVTSQSQISVFSESATFNSCFSA